MPLGNLRGQIDPLDKMLLRDWLVDTCDIVAVNGYDEEGEMIDAPRKKNIACKIDEQSFRYASSVQEIIPIDVAVIFGPDTVVKENDRLENLKIGATGEFVFKDSDQNGVRVISVDPVRTNTRGLTQKTAKCARN